MLWNLGFSDPSMIPSDDPVLLKSFLHLFLLKKHHFDHILASGPMLYTCKIYCSTVVYSTVYVLNRIVLYSIQSERNTLGKCCNDAAQRLNLNQIILKSQNNKEKKWFLTLKSKYVYLQPECLLYHSILGCALDGFEATRLFCYAVKMILAALSYSVKESVKGGGGAGFFLSAAYKSLCSHGNRLRCQRLQP